MKTRNTGFTLIELSIVLVIVALLVAGILVGQELVKAAQVRKMTTQFDMFNTATNTFRSKYNCLPGDCSNAANLGFSDSFGNSSYINGNGNGQVLGTAGSTDTSGTETSNYWRHLSESGMIADKMDNPGYTGVCGGVPGVNSPSGVLIKRAVQNCVQDLNQGGWWLSFQPPYNASSNANLQFPGHIFTTGPCATFGCNINGGDSLTPVDAYAIDAKLDDGMPYSSFVRARSQSLGGGLAIASAGAAGSAACINSALTPNVYNVTSSDNTCNLALGAKF